MNAIEYAVVVVVAGIVIGFGFAGAVYLWHYLFKRNEE